jgi:6,7-dimethyl-8-ribityllumazine synthase
MATRNLSQYVPDDIPSAQGMKIGMVVSEWNNEITFALRDGAIQTLIKHGINEDDIIIRYVPGSFELTAGALLLATHTQAQSVICLGCVIQGETPHFDYICQGVAYGLTQVTINYNRPVIFGVLTTLNKEQALARAGGALGNKGVEAAITAIKMVALKQEYCRF